MTGEPIGRPPTPAERDAIARMMTAAEIPARSGHRCGAELWLRDFNRVNIGMHLKTCSGWVTFKYQPESSVSVPDGRIRNGYRSAGWQSIVRDCLSYITAAEQAERDWRLCFGLEGNGPDGMFYRVDLIRELELEPLAGMLGIELAELREYLGGFALIGRKP